MAPTKQNPSRPELASGAVRDAANTHTSIIRLYNALPDSETRDRVRNLQGVSAVLQRELAQVRDELTEAAERRAHHG